jgi:hypothetical protein
MLYPLGLVDEQTIINDAKNRGISMTVIDSLINTIRSVKDTWAELAAGPQLKGMIKDLKGEMKDLLETEQEKVANLELALRGARLQMAEHDKLQRLHPIPQPQSKFNASPSPIYKIGDGKRAPMRDNLMSTRHSVAGEAIPDNYSALFNKISVLETSVSRALTSRGGNSRSFEASLMNTPIDPPDLGDTQGAKQPKNVNNDWKDLLVSLQNTQFAGDSTDLVTTTNLLRSLTLKLSSNGY